MAELSPEYTQAIDWLEAHKPAPSAAFLSDLIKAHLKLLEDEMVARQDSIELRKDLQQHVTVLQEVRQTLLNVREELREKHAEIRRLNNKMSNQDLAIRELQDLKKKIQNFTTDIEPYFNYPGSDSSGN